MYHTLGILSSLYLCILNLTQGNVKFDMPPAIKNPENKNQLIHLIVESLFVFHFLSVCVSVFFLYVSLSMCSCFNVYLCVSLCLCQFLCVCVSPSSLLSSKACHLVVDWAAKGKVFFPFLRKNFLYATTCLLMNLGLFLYLAICGRASNLERFSN